MIDRNLAEIYGVETKVLNQAVKRNTERFPSSFQFQLSENEYYDYSRSQIVTLNDQSENTKIKRGQNFSFSIAQPVVAQLKKTDFIESIIGVADYQLSRSVPDGLKSTLPQIEDLENELSNLNSDNA